MAKDVLDLRCERGVTFRRKITWKDAAGNPVPLGGLSIRMPVVGSDGSVLVEPSTANGKITLSADQLSATVLLTDEETAAYPTGTYSYRLLIEPADGAVDRLFRGQFQVS